MEYQVGSPWILDGKMFFPETGMPMRKRARSKVVLAVALPEPLIVLQVSTKSLTTAILAYFFAQ